MNIKPLKKIISDDRTASFQQNAMAEVVNSLSSNPFLVGNFLSEMKDPSPNVPEKQKKMVPIKLGTTPLKIPHGLGTKPMGYLVVNQNANATIFRIDPPLPMDPRERMEAEKDAARFITLQASAEVTVKLWVF